MRKKSDTAEKPGSFITFMKKVPYYAKVTLKFSITAAPMAIICSGFIYLVLFTWKNANNDQQFLLKSSEEMINAALPEGEIPRDLLEELQKLQSKSNNVSLLDPDTPYELKEIYNDSPWIEDTYFFKRDFSNKTIVADFSVRLPVAQVRYGRYYYIVDENGAILPSIKTTKPDNTLPLIICNIHNEPTNEKKWVNEELLSALNVIQDINCSIISDKIDIGKIVVRRSRYVDSTLQRRTTLPSLEIYTKTGAVIKWGTDNKDDSEEPNNLQKIETIRRIIGREGRFSRGDNLDVRTKSVYYSNSAMR